MKKTIALFCLGLGLTISVPTLAVPAQTPLRSVAASTQSSSVGLDEQLFYGRLGQSGDKQALLQSIDHSLRYLNTQSARDAYRNYPVRGVTRDRVRRSLIRFRQLVLNSRSPEQLQAAVKREFTLYKSVGRDDGTVFFTGYYEPIYAASRVRTEEYRYPLYRKPSNLNAWTAPHPTRAQLEGTDGTGSRSPLNGYELVWLRDRLEAYLVHIQGSARLTLTDGSEMTVGYAGHTDYSYVSIGREMAKEGRLPLDGLTLPVMIDYFKRVPQDLDVFLPRNHRFIFFQETHGAPATGSLNVPVTADRSIATDKAMMPPGALALVHTRIPYPNQNGGMDTPTVSRFVLDQDTGSAIKTPGRVDLFLGTGPVAGARAGIVGWTGDLYYLLLRN
ncbi:MltA domain-containing protein [Lusitaniella coriacea LEGE 07157]|uniref:peptidoglycan lytic exotransglycosylase n=1 Tax=Lusitaniella coriacea LEGE 07157 TaxID=945747 RepID=A0A8J7DVX9_9CYAN|nr:MltA domain-containing protein [Lusitaniella coriacea]MBE9116124.1 MltA domain-containing protein [Lusitaniella coriacea LEGE 07157]